jgi:hypothetical protein
MAEIDLFVDRDKNQELFDALERILYRYGTGNHPSIYIADSGTLRSLERLLQDLNDVPESTSTMHRVLISRVLYATSNALTIWKVAMELLGDAVLYRKFIHSLSEFTKLATRVLSGMINMAGFSEILPEILAPALFHINGGKVDLEIEIVIDELRKEEWDVWIDDLPGYLAGIAERLDRFPISLSKLRRSQEKGNESTGGRSIRIPESVIVTPLVWQVDLWIDTTNAVPANKFMHHLAMIIGYIDDTAITVIDTRIGSLSQRWKLIFRNLFAKERTKDILAKGAKAAEAALLDKHIEPIEKSKAERKQIDAEVNQLMTEEQAREMNDLIIEDKKQDVLAKKLANMEKALDIQARLSDLMARGLLEIDDDYRIMINGLLLIEQKNKVIKTDEMDNLDSTTTN